MKDVDWNLVFEILKIVAVIVVAAGIKAKIWTESDFDIAKKIIVSGFALGKGKEIVSAEVSAATKLTTPQALKEIVEVHKDLTLDEKPLSKKIQRAGRKLFWRLFDGGL